MKTPSNRFRIPVLLALAIAAGCLTAGTVLAAWRECRDVDGAAAAVHAELSRRSGYLETAHRDGLARLSIDRDTMDTGRETNRVRADGILELQFSALEAHAISSRKAAAIAEFKAAVMKAIKARRTAADRAIAEFRRGLDTELTTRRGRIDAARTALERDVNAEFSRSKSECGGARPVPEVQNGLRSSLGAVKQRFISEIRLPDPTEAAIARLSERQRDALAAAEKTMRAQLEAARAQFVRASR